MKTILEALLQILIPIILTFIFLRERNKANFIRIGVFIIVYVLYSFILSLHFNIINLKWNWEGKIYAIIFAIICYFTFKSYFEPHNFFTLKQEPKTNKITWIVTAVLIFLAILGGYFSETIKFDAETLAFQFTMPHSDEEPFFRGIFLGLLLTALPEKNRFFGNPAVLVTAVLFGLAHALSLDKNFELSFNIGAFIMTGFLGWIFSWLAVKSRSLLKPIIGHLAINGLGDLISMIK